MNKLSDFHGFGVGLASTHFSGFVDNSFRIKLPEFSVKRVIQWSILSYPHWELSLNFFMQTI